jgi:calcineurin-like phosphoesterase family protein
LAIKFGQKIKTDNSTKKYWVTSDLHFHHKGVLNFCPNTRPWPSVEDMNEGLISHWNDTVDVEDEVLFLGDFSFKAREATEAILTRLNGSITFVLGNHDRVLRDQIKGLTTYDYLEFRLNGTKVCSMHFHISNFNQQGRGSIQLFGHSHGSYQPEGRAMDCGWDMHGRILPLQEAVDMCLARDIYCPDQHKVVEK